MKIYKVIQETEIVNYKPVNEDIYSKYYRGVVGCYHHRINSEKLFISKEKASETYDQMLEEIRIGADEEINKTNIIYYVHNIWNNSGYPYKTISCVRIEEIELEQ